MATVANLGMPGQPIDPRIGSRNMTSPFTPNGTNTLAMAVTTSSQVFQLPRNTAGGDDCVRLVNTGTTPVRFRFGLDNTVVATLQDKVIPAGAVEIFRIGAAKYIAVIGAAAGTLEADMGVGV